MQSPPSIYFGQCCPRVHWGSFGKLDFLYAASDGLSGDPHPGRTAVSVLSLEAPPHWGWNPYTSALPIKPLRSLAWRTPFLFPLTHPCSRYKRMCYFLLLVYIYTCLPSLSFPWWPFPWLAVGITHSSWPSYLPSFPVMWPDCLGLSSGQLPFSVFSVHSLGP